MLRLSQGLGLSARAARGFYKCQCDEACDGDSKLRGEVVNVVDGFERKLFLFFFFVEQATVESAVEPVVTKETKSETSSEELEGFHIVRSIVRELVATRRIVMRDAQSYCAILLDDNNRKPICRLRFNNLQKLRIGLFNEAKEEEQFPLESIDDIYNFSAQLRATVASSITLTLVEPASGSRAEA